MHAYFPKDYASIHAEYFELSRSYYIQYAHATPCPVTHAIISSSYVPYFCFFILEIFTKHDGYIYPKPGTISWDRVNMAFGQVQFHDRRTFLQFSFPKWSGFFVNSFDESIKPEEALQNLACLVESTSNVWTSTSGYPYCHSIRDSELRIWEASICTRLWEMVQILITPNIVVYTRTFFVQALQKYLLSYPPCMHELTLNIEYKV